MSYNMKQLDSRRAYFDICFLHKTIHNNDICTHSRPIFRINHYANRNNLKFSPQTPRTDFGLHKNPITRSQILYNKNFGNVDILLTNEKSFKKAILELI